MKATPLHNLGRSIRRDNITRDLLTGDTLKSAGRNLPVREGPQQKQAV